MLLYFLALPMEIRCAEWCSTRQSSDRTMRRQVFFLVTLCTTLAPLGCSRRPQVDPPGPPEVTVSLPLVRTVADYEDFIGRIDSTDYVEIKARVTGYLTKVCFKDGDFVQAGQLLYEV